MTRRLRSLAFSALLGFLPAAAMAAGGFAFLSDTINWSQTPPLNYTVVGGPPNMCGSLVTYRNGSWLVSPNWICTDGNGSVTKGPWYWTNTPGDQFDDDLYIAWNDGTRTNTVDHWWDKTCPTNARTSAGGAPPAALSGRATDTPYGAGFNVNWTRISTVFKDTTTSLCWLPGHTAYDAPCNSVDATTPVAGRPTMNWSHSAVPPASAHVTGHSYRWTTCMTDGDTLCGDYCIFYDFTL